MFDILHPSTEFFGTSVCIFGFEHVNMLMAGLIPEPYEQDSRPVEDFIKQHRYDTNFSHRMPQFRVQAVTLY